MPDSTWRKKAADAKSIVVKVGTSALTDERGRLDEKFLASLAGQIASVMRRGTAVTLVSSGAVGAGMAELELETRPKTLPMLQAAAAVGQGRLMQRFQQAFGRRGVKVAQILLTRGDFENRKRYLNIRNTITALQELGVVPIINENDTVAVDELRFGDNDVISAHITNMIRADLLVLLTVVDGVMAGGEVIECITDAAEAAGRLPTAARSKLGSGGMAAKLTAAAMANAAGETVIIANARAEKILGRILDGQRVGTLCVPASDRMSSRRRWIGQAGRSAGRIAVDAGAVEALRSKGRSLLPSGVTAVRGSFNPGDIVVVEGPDGKPVARGLVNYDSAQADAIKGLKTSQIAAALNGEKPYDELIHRDNLVLV